MVPGSMCGQAQSKATVGSIRRTMSQQAMARSISSSRSMPGVHSLVADSFECNDLEWGLPRHLGCALRPAMLCSGQFCGMARMTSSIDYARKLECWQRALHHQALSFAVYQFCALVCTRPHVDKASMEHHSDCRTSGVVDFPCNGCL